ncbi:CHAD domain-containing protein [Aeromicrobium sp.]|uniref:CHAD domain-containing protein n=1 Tax=Aeromicrobium sp. TaxID=1871063 RepID=UPI003D6A4C1D
MGVVLPEIESTLKPAEESPQGRSTAADVIGLRLREQVAELMYQDPLVRRDVPDSVHKMRVAIRRLRSALATFRPLLDRERTEPLRDELTWIAGVLGTARDAEVKHQQLAALIADEPFDIVLDRFSRRVDRDLGDAYRLAHRRSIEAMQSERYYTLIDNLEALMTNPPWTPPADQQATDVLPARVSKEFKRFRRCAAAAEDAPDRPMRDERLHEVRKAAKRARYAAEPLVPIYGRDAAQFAEAIERVQTVLGDYHDVVITHPLLRQLTVQADLDGDNALLYGRLLVRLRARAADLRTEYSEAWSQANRKKRRSWLT